MTLRLTILAACLIAAALFWVIYGGDVRTIDEEQEGWRE